MHVPRRYSPTADQPGLMAGPSATRLAALDERDVDGPRDRWWELTLFKTTAGGYVLESVFRSTMPQGRPMAATLAFADARELMDFLLGTEQPSSLAEALLSRAAQSDPALGFGGEA